MEEEVLMFDSKRSKRYKFFLITAAFPALLLVACSGNEDPQEGLPSQTTSQVTPELLPPPPLPPPPIRRVQPTRSTVKVIEDGGEADRPKTLAEASRLAKSRKGRHGPSVAEINDDNLHEYAEKGEVIVLESPPAAPVMGSQSQEESDAVTDEPEGERDETYWRRRALELRMGWRRTVDSILELQLEAAALRQQFYAEDDPYIRDGQVKPSWDRALDRLAQLEQRSEQYSNELEIFVEEGRRSDVPQGWLNEGWELEPTEDELTWKNGENKDVQDHQAIEPPILSQEIRNR